jgi:hypothetical protein
MLLNCSHFYQQKEIVMPNSLKKTAAEWLDAALRLEREGKSTRMIDLALKKACERELEEVTANAT